MKYDQTNFKYSLFDILLTISIKNFAKKEIKNFVCFLVL